MIINTDIILYVDTGTVFLSRNIVSVIVPLLLTGLLVLLGVELVQYRQRVSEQVHELYPQFADLQYEVSPYIGDPTSREAAPTVYAQYLTKHEQTRL